MELELPHGSTVGAALEALLRREPALAAPAASCRAAVGLDFARPDHVLEEGDEISLIPPVQGG